jgi:hypothetical protein
VRDKVSHPYKTTGKIIVLYGWQSPFKANKSLNLKNNKYTGQGSGQRESSDMFCTDLPTLQSTRWTFQHYGLLIIAELFKVLAYSKWCVNENSVVNGT